MVVAKIESLRLVKEGVKVTLTAKEWIEINIANICLLP